VIVQPADCVCRAERGHKELTPPRGMPCLRPLGMGCTVLTSTALEANQEHVQYPVQTW
jgi:hypothetical protein